MSGWRAPAIAGWLACSALLSACGAASSPGPLAQRLCDGARSAASAQLGRSVTVRILSRDPAQLECNLIAPGLRVRIVSQATAQAYVEFDTETSHQDQVFGSGVHKPAQIPTAVSVPGAVVAVWIRAQRELVGTDATPTGHGGAYVTVTVGGSGARGAGARALARAVAQAVFSAHPGVGA